MKTLIVITGATGSGKTSLAIDLARRLGCHIISADSRQIYKGIPIVTAAPSREQLAAVPHHFVGMLPLDAAYSAADYESDVMQLLPRLWAKGDFAVMCGGSMMYVDAVCNGIDLLPTISPEVRQRVLGIYADGGLAAVRAVLSNLDPAGYERVDPLNPRRNIHAVEICLQSGRPASSMLTGQRKHRDFNIIKVFIDMPREELFARINTRVDMMLHEGLEAEARSVYHLRHLNSLNTVGLKEMFACFDGQMDFGTAVARIAKNTRVYAKKQLTWLKKDTSARPVKTAADILAMLF